METHSSAIVATSTTAATSVAEIEKFLSRRQSRQKRRCTLLMETTRNFSSGDSDKNASQSTFHTVKTSGNSSLPGTFFKMASSGEVNVVFFMEEVQKYDCIYNKYSKVIKTSILRLTAGEDRRKV